MRGGIMRAGKLDPYFGHTGQITDVYIPPSIFKLWSIQGRQFLFTQLNNSGWKDLIAYGRSKAKNLYAWRELRKAASKFHESWKYKKFVADATEMYKSLHTGIAEGKTDIVRSSVTELYFSVTLQTLLTSNTLLAIKTYRFCCSKANWKS
jgi:hypothetical protein